MIKSGLLCLVLFLTPPLVLAQQANERQVMAEVLVKDDDPAGTALRKRVALDREPMRWTVVAASYPARAAADSAAAAYYARLAFLGYPVAVMADETQGAPTYRVIVGRFQRLAEAQTELASLGEEVPGGWVLNVPASTPEPVWLSREGALVSNKGEGTDQAPAYKPPTKERSMLEELSLLEAQPVIEEPSVADAETVYEDFATAEEESGVKRSPFSEKQFVAASPLVEEPVALDREPMRWTVVAASYPARAAADSAVAAYYTRLAVLDYPVAVMADETQGAPTYHVIVGRFQRLAEAQTELASLDAEGGGWVLNVPASTPEPAWLSRAEAGVSNDGDGMDHAPAHKPLLAEATESVQQSALSTKRPTKVATLPMQTIVLESPDRVYRDQRRWAVVVASYAESTVADVAAVRYRTRLEPTGYPVAVVADETQDGITYQVIVGQFDHLEAAQAGLETLAAEVPDHAWLLSMQADEPDEPWMLYVQAVMGRPYPGVPEPREQAGSVVEASIAKVSSGDEEDLDALEESPALFSDRAPAAESARQSAIGFERPVAIAASAEQDVALRGLALIDGEPMRWTVVAASYADSAAADSAAAGYYARLAFLGYPVAVMADETQVTPTYRVIVGRFQHLAEAQTELASLGEEVPGGWVLNVPASTPEPVWLSREGVLVGRERPRTDTLRVQESPIEASSVPGAKPDTEKPSIRGAESVTEESSVVIKDPARDEASSLVEKQPAAEAQTMPEGSADASDLEPMPWTVVAASYTDRAAADRTATAYRTRLETMGYPVSVIADEGQGGITYRVSVGQFQRLSAAQAGQQDMGDEIPSNAWLLHVQQGTRRLY